MWVGPVLAQQLQAALGGRPVALGVVDVRLAVEADGAGERRRRPAGGRRHVGSAHQQRLEDAVDAGMRIADKERVDVRTEQTVESRLTNHLANHFALIAFIYVHAGREKVLHAVHQFVIVGSPADMHGEDMQRRVPVSVARQ